MNVFLFIYAFSGAKIRYLFELCVGFKNFFCNFELKIDKNRIFNMVKELKEIIKRGDNYS